MAAGSIRIAICVATFQRPAMLAALLASLGALRFDEDPTPDVRLIVVDNDAAGSARAIVEAAAGQSSLPTTYLIEPTRNISLARNAAVAHALAQGAQFIAFVDDDEVVDSDWLQRLLYAQAEFDADAVCGPVLPRYPDDVAGWIVRGGYFEPRLLPTGHLIDFGMTCNALVTAPLLHGLDEVFDPRFGTSGGGDALFFMRAHLGGARIVWCAEAIVEESIPPSRAQAGWILRRSFRIGHAYVRCRRASLPARRWLVPSLLEAVARIGYGTLNTLLALPRGRAPVVRALRTVMHGAGALTALAGFGYEEYTTVHGG